MSQKTFFSRRDSLFCTLPDDKSLPTTPFLAAASQILHFISYFGPGFRIVKNDVDGNIKKLLKKQAMNPELYVTINAMLEDETTKNDDDLAQIAALWLKRGLDFLCTYLEQLHANRDDGTDSLWPYATHAYEQTLKPHHNFIVQTTFKALLLFTPNKSTSIVSYKDDKTVDDKLVYEEIEVYMKLLRENVAALHELLVKYKIESEVTD